MRKVRALKRFAYEGKIVEVGEVIEVMNNDAHTLIDRDVAELMIPLNLEQIKMMIPQKKKGYKTK